MVIMSTSGNCQKSVTQPLLVTKKHYRSRAEKDLEVEAQQITHHHIGMTKKSRWKSIRHPGAQEEELSIEQVKKNQPFLRPLTTQQEEDETLKNFFPREGKMVYARKRQLKIGLRQFCHGGGDGLFVYGPFV